jgi:transposase-like protein
MEERNTGTASGSRPEWRALDVWARGQIQDLLQNLLEAEVTDLLGRVKSERLPAVDAPTGYRNGHGKPRRLTLGCGTVAVKRPRVRGREGRFREPSAAAVQEADDGGERAAARAVPARPGRG